MLIDKKREKMFFQCRERKKKLDCKLAIAKAALIVPPILMLAGTILDVLLSFFGDTAILLTGAGLWGFKVAGSSIMNLIIILASAGLVLYAACLTIFKDEKPRKLIFTVYVAAFFIALLFLIFFRAFDMAFFCAYSIFAIPVARWNESLLKIDEEMSTLDGYPHFNPMLMADNESPDKKVSAEEIDNMTPDERIMFERGWDSKRNY